MLASRRAGNFLGFLACVALMGYALYAQYVLNLFPCPLCIFQRIAVIAVGLIFLIAAVHNPGAFGARIYGALLFLAAATGIGVSARHVWIQAQPPGTVPSCGAGLDYMLDIMPLSRVISKVLSGSGECAEINWRFLGLSMPWWVLFSLIALAAWAVWNNVRRRNVTPRA
jgi:disulfide bond formation protein DsbB